MLTEDDFFEFVDRLQWEWATDFLSRAYVLIGLNLTTDAPSLSHNAGLMVIAIEANTPA
jgi:hypothetical protein